MLTTQNNDQNVENQPESSALTSEPSQAQGNTETASLKRAKEANLLNSILLMIGSIIGTGIFMNPNSIVESIPSVFFSLLIWVICGVIALLAVLCYAKLGLMFPACGGEYTYFSKAFNELLAFSFIFTNFFFIKPTSVAILVLFFVENVVLACFPSLTEPPFYPTRLISIVVTLLICTLNCTSNYWSLKLNDLLTYSKFVCMLMLIGMAFYKLCIGEFENIRDWGFSITVSASSISKSLYNGMWAYDGFNQLAYMVEDMKKPEKLLVPASFISLSVILVFYLLVNFSYLVILGVQGVSNSTSVAQSAALPYMGKWSVIVAILVSLSAFGSANATAFCCGRIYLDAARNHHMPRIFAAVHKRQRTLIPPLVIQSLLVSIFLISASNIATLLNYFSGGQWVFYTFAFAAIPVAVYRGIAVKTKFKLPIFIPILLACVGFSIVILGFVQSWVDSLISISLILVSLIVYFVFIFRNGVIPEHWYKPIDKATDALIKFAHLEIPPTSSDQSKQLRQNQDCEQQETKDLVICAT